MTTIQLTAAGSRLSTYIAVPALPGPRPGVVVIHDALGMSQDLRNQADWLASEGYLAAAPDLFDGRTLFGCLRSTIRDFNRGSGPLYDKIEAARQWLLQPFQALGVAQRGAFFCPGGGAFMPCRAGAAAGKCGMCCPPPARFLP
ncbi:MAG: dienelactone hydrolase family protein [Chloroflexi bacterium]|nr:dienelactone hydrolase family protein [Chloroflexota bacterium]